MKKREEGSGSTRLVYITDFASSDEKAKHRAGYLSADSRTASETLALTRAFWYILLPYKSIVSPRSLYLRFNTRPAPLPDRKDKLKLFAQQSR